MTKNVPTPLVLGAEILHENEEPGPRFEADGYGRQQYGEGWINTLRRRGLLLQFAVPEVDAPDRGV